MLLFLLLLVCETMFVCLACNFRLVCWPAREVFSFSIISLDYISENAMVQQCFNVDAQISVQNKKKHSENQNALEADRLIRGVWSPQGTASFAIRVTYTEYNSYNSRGCA